MWAGFWGPRTTRLQTLGHECEVAVEFSSLNKPSLLV